MMNEQEKRVFFNLVSGKYSSLSQMKADRDYSNFVSDSKNIFNDAFSKQESFISKANKAVSSLGGTIGNIGSSVVKTGSNLVFSTLKDQIDNRPIAQISDAEKIINSVARNGLNFFAQFNSLISGGVEFATRMLDDAFEREKQLLNIFARQVGIPGDIAKDFGKGIDAITPKAMALGISFNEIAESTSQMVSNSQKLSSYQGETIFNALKVSAAYGETAQSLLISNEAFRDIGISLKDASEDFELIGKRSMEQGLLAKATTKTVIENLSKLNEFGFNNGVKGLSNMVMQAQALKFNMNETFIIANKVFSPEGAIEVAGNLQVLGGAFGDLIDPIKMLYDSANNVEALQSSYLEAAKSLATYNAEQQRFEVTGANLRRAKAMADALGTSLNELTGAAIKGRVQMEAMSEIELFDLTDDQKKFVSNLSSMQGGVLGIEVSKDLAKQMNIKEGFIEFSQLTSKQMARIADVQASLKNKTTEQIIKDQFNVTTQLLNTVNSIALSVGNFSRDKINNSTVNQEFANMVKKLDNFSSMTPEDIDREYNKFVGNIINPSLEHIKKIASGVSDFVGDVVQTVSPKLNENLNKGGEVVKEYFNNKLPEQIKQVIQFDIGLKIQDRDSDVANLLVDSLKRSPQAMQELTDSIVLKTGNYLKQTKE